MFFVAGFFYLRLMHPLCIQRYMIFTFFRHW